MDIATPSSKCEQFYDSPREASTILLVDDDEVLRDIGSTILKVTGFSVMTAANGREALDIYQQRQGKIDLVLLDMVMPVMGGAETYNELRSMSLNLPVVICSGYGVAKFEHIIKHDEYADYIRKPYKIELLRNMMLRMINAEK